jgi:hypothetical protein
MDKTTLNWKGGDGIWLAKTPSSGTYIIEQRCTGDGYLHLSAHASDGTDLGMVDNLTDAKSLCEKYYQSGVPPMSIGRQEDRKLLVRAIKQLLREHATLGRLISKDMTVEKFSDGFLDNEDLWRVSWHHGDFCIMSGSWGSEHDYDTIEEAEAVGRASGLRQWSLHGKVNGTMFWDVARSNRGGWYAFESDERGYDRGRFLTDDPGRKEKSEAEEDGRGSGLKQCPRKRE